MLRHRASLTGLFVLLGLGLGLSACGNAVNEYEKTHPLQSPSTTAVAETPTATPSTEKPLPRCGAVWKPGKRLPNHYRGCMSNGKVVAASKITCSSGQHLETYRDHLYAVRGGPVISVPSLKTSAKYAQAKRACEA